MAGGNLSHSVSQPLSGSTMHRQSLLHDIVLRMVVSEGRRRLLILDGRRPLNDPALLQTLASRLRDLL
jgi:hypothetical protein